MRTVLDDFPRRRVAVIGDVMLDRYITGDVERISPEAPVPVVRAQAERIVPGGAANVATNLAGLGVQANLVGITGQDAARDLLLGALGETGRIDCTGVLAAAGHRTTQKLRVIGAHQQIVRIDHEDAGNIDPALAARLIAAACTAVETADVVVLSDYNKGACSDALVRAVIDHAHMLNKPVLVDPKRRDLGIYRGAALLTPNRKELSEATGLSCETDAEAAGAVAAAQQRCGAPILLTRSEKGMSFYPVAGSASHMATVAQDVFDVSGAGDTVVAVMAAAVAAQLSIVDGMRLANHAAGIVVSKMGTAIVTRDELVAALAADTIPATVNDGRLLDRDGAVALRWSWAREKLTVGFANGCFDLLHPGHVSLIRQAAEGCDRLIVALNSDASVRRLKGATRPIQDEAARAAVMGAIKGVSAVVLFGEDTPLELIAALQPDMIVKGADYTEDRVVGAELVRARGGRVMLVDLSAGHSTSRLVAAAQTD